MERQVGEEMLGLGELRRQKSQERGGRGEGEGESILSTLEREGEGGRRMTNGQGLMRSHRTLSQPSPPRVSGRE
jgi:hypothetical protein